MENDKQYQDDSLVPRSRLDALLADAFAGPLVVLNAGAGFGKTTAVSHYLSQSRFRAVWFSFAAPDAIPARFWEHLTRVFARHRPGLGAKMQALGFPATLQQFGGFIAELTDELYRDDLAVAFVFDDVHLMTDPAVKAFVANLISSRLENSTIALLTRAWPVFEQPLPVVPRMVEASELRFSLDETVALLARAGLENGPEAAAQVQRYVSGWPVALSLVALAMRRQAQSGVADAALSSAKPSLHSLFEREVFSQYSRPEQDLLVKLSVLDSFPRGLVQAVTGEARRDLGPLLNSNIFIRYDAEAMRLSFRPLYLEFLRDKRQSVRPQELEDTYRKAAAWCRANGHYYDAARYYSQCAAYDELWQTLLDIDPVRHSKSEAEFIIDELGQLPDAFIENNPMTRIVWAAMLTNNLRFGEAAKQLDTVRARLEAAGADAEAQALLGEHYIVRGLLALAQEQNGFEKHFKKAAELLPGGSRRWGGKLRLIDLGPGLNLQSAKAGALKKSLACFTQGVPCMVRVLHGAGQGLDKLCESEALFLTGELKRAAEPAWRAVYDANTAAQYDIVGNALFILLRVYVALGDYARVLDTLEHVQRYEKDPAAQTLGIWDITRAWFYAEVGEVEKVALWIRNPIQKGFAPVSVDRPMLVRLRCLVAAGQYAEALALLQQFEAAAKGKGAVITLLYAQLGRAVTCHYLGRFGEAADALKAAYGLARGNRMYMPFIEYGSRARALLERAKETGGHGIPGDWLDTMLAKAGTYAKRHASLAGRYRQEREGRQTDYGLSPRETELIVGLSQGLTREELAEVMQLSINTVKSMTKLVFAKLGAVNAADAVRIAIVGQLI